MNIFWYALVDFIPKSIAPNLITLIGTAMIYLSTLILYFYGYDFETEKPSWVYLFAVYALWIYQTFDALDGK